MAYASHKLKRIFDVHALDLVKVAKGFGFDVPPRVDLSIKMSGRNSRGKNKGGAKEKRQAGGRGKAFSADNPYGNKGSSDKRQFSY
jgi:ATP-dependent RNA helicase DDX18/HAS1